MRKLLVVLAMLGSCAASAPNIANVDELIAQGHQHRKGMHLTNTGERRESEYKVWWKEIRDSERRVHFCLVPGVNANFKGYHWLVTVFIDGQETWSYQSGPFRGKPSRRLGIDCALSDPLPDGRLRFMTRLRCWAPGGRDVC